MSANDGGVVALVRRGTHGRIVNISSGAGSHGDAEFGLTTNRGSVASYGISKAALNALTSKLAAELEGTGILVNSACPAASSATANPCPGDGNGDDAHED